MPQTETIVSWTRDEDDAPGLPEGLLEGHGSEPRYLTVDDVSAMTGAEVFDVYVPEWDATVRCMDLSYAVLSEITSAYNAEEPTTAALFELQARLAAASLVDPKMTIEQIRNVRGRYVQGVFTIGNAVSARSALTADTAAVDATFRGGD